MSRRPDLIVVGTGVTGLMTALSLSEAGLHPIVIPAPEVPDLLPQVDLSLLPPWHYPPVLGQLEQRGMRLLPELITGLSQDTGVDLALASCSLLLMEADSKEAADWSGAHRDNVSVGRVSDFEPQLSLGHRKAICLGQRPQVRSDRLARALGLALARCGVEIHARSSVKRLNVAGNIVLGVELNDGRNLRAEATVLAADQASSAVLHHSGLEPIAGSGILVPALQLAPSSAALNGAVVDESMLLMPRLDHRLLAISRLDLNQRVALTPAALRQAVHDALPGLGRHDLERTGRIALPTSQLRAAIGAYPGIRGFWLNTGHDSTGPVIAAAAAEFLSEQLAGGPMVRELAVTFS